MKATDDLRAAWEAWRRRPLPRIADDEELDDAWTELEELDSGIAGVVAAVIGGGEPADLELLRPNVDLRARITARLGDPDPVTARDAQALLAYLDDLEGLLSLVQRTHEQTRPKRSGR